MLLRALLTLTLLLIACDGRSPREKSEAADARTQQAQTETTRTKVTPPTEPPPPPAEPATVARVAIESAARGASLAADLPQIVRLERRPERPAGPCGRWPAQLEPVSQSAREAAAKLLPDGALVGAVRSDRAVVQTRLAAPGKVRVYYSAGPDCEDQRSRSVTLEAPEPAPRQAPFYTAKIALRGLEPGTRYRYRVAVDGAGEGLPGFFTTAPTDDVPVRIAFGADFFTRSDEFFALLPQAAAVDADVFLNLGDWPYADAAPPATTLDAFRQKHADSRAFPAMQDLMRASAILSVWDDHEVLNDWDGRDSERKPELVAAGTRAWREFFPVDAADEAAATEPPGIFRKLDYGPGLELFVLDTRSYRSKNSAPDGPDKTMLGTAQRDWLLDEVTRSDATFKVIVSSVPLVQATTRDDAWDGYRHERDALLDAIVERGLTGVVFVSGDQHWLAVHHTHHGFKEFQVGPTAAFLRSPRPAPPAWVRTQQAVLNLGLLDYTPQNANTPASLRFRAIGEDDLVLYEEDVPRQHGALRIETASRYVAWQLDGRHVFTGTGTTELRHVPVGDYRITWRSAVPGLEVESPQLVRVEPGEQSVLRSTARAATEPLAFDAFDTLGEPAPEPIAWQPIDKGRHGTPSRWKQVGDTMGQFAPVRSVKKLPETRGSTPDELLRPGTHLLARQTSLADMALTVDVLPGDEDGWGVMWGVQRGDDGAPHSFYRVDFDAARGGWRLLEVVDGQPTVLAEDLAFTPPQARWTTLRIERRGAKHQGWLDGERLAEAHSDRLGAGAIGLYSWSMSDLRFDNLVVMP